MKEYFVLADTHSFFDEMIVALTEKGFDVENPEHIIIHCGDLCDRGPKSKEIVEFIYNLMIKDRCIFVKGNHEDLFKEMIRRGEYLSHDVTNGTVKTLGQLQEKKLNEYEAMVDFDYCAWHYNKHFDYIIANAVNYYETPKHIFVHGWIPVIEMEAGKFSYDPNWRNASQGEWVNARWTNGVRAAKQGVIEPNKEIVCGHWHASYGRVIDMIKEDPKNKKAYEALEYTKNMAMFLPYYDNRSHCN